MLLIPNYYKKTKKTRKLQITNLSILRYITSNKNLFVKISLIYLVISIANSRTILVKEIKIIKIKVRNLKEKTINIVIYRILYILKYSKNLLF